VPNHYGHFVDGSFRLQFVASGSIPDLAQISNPKHLISKDLHPKFDAWSFRSPPVFFVNFDPGTFEAWDLSNQLQPEISLNLPQEL
jgi:hypothetical protein